MRKLMLILPLLLLFSCISENSGKEGRVKIWIDEDGTHRTFEGVDGSYSHCIDGKLIQYDSGPVKDTLHISD